MQYVLTGTVAIKDGFASEKFIDHTEIIDANSPEEAIELSLGDFTEEEEAVWHKGPTVQPRCSNCHRTPTKSDGLCDSCRTLFKVSAEMRDWVAWHNI